VDTTYRRLLWLRRLAGAAAALLLAVTSLGAYMRLSHSGSGCSPWPQCYGQELHQPALGSAAATGAAAAAATPLANLAHRVFAVLALFAVGAAAWVCLGTTPRLRRPGAIALLVLGLGLGLDVLVPWSEQVRASAGVLTTMLGSLLAGFAMLALSARLAVTGVALPAIRPRRWAGLGIVLLLAQTCVGGLASAEHAALGCGDWAQCLTAAQSAGWEALNPWREPRSNPAAGVDPQGAFVLVLHWAAGIALAVLVLPLSALAMRRGRPSSAAALLILLFAQVAVGLMMSLNPGLLQFALLHNVLAGALLATLVLMF
jgi:heme a synthase